MDPEPRPKRRGPTSHLRSGSAVTIDALERHDPFWAPPGWKPTLIDYMYVSFTNASAFSPADTMPLSHTAKWLMTGQSLTALVTVGLVAARAVNILNG